MLDEFALILHLEDDYWKKEGRASVQAVALVTACLACLLVGLSPFGVDDLDGGGRRVRLIAVAAVLVAIAATVVCVLKGKYRLALVAIFVPLVAVVGAVRLARPGSRWDRRHYGRRPHRHRRAVERTRAFDARWDPAFRRIGDIIAGGPRDDRVQVRSP